MLKEKRGDNMKGSKFRFVFLALAVVTGGWLAWYGAFQVLVSKFLTDGASTAILTQSEAASLGIIGGADGPTAIMVATTAGPDWDLILVGGLFIVGLVGYFLLRKRKSVK